MTTITETLVRADGSPASAVATIQVVGVGGVPVAAAYTTAGTLVRPVQAYTDASGVWAADLIPTGDLVPSGLVYRVSLSGAHVDATPRFITVADSESTIEVADCLADTPGSVAPTGLATLAARVTALELFIGTATFLTLGD